MTDQLAFSDEPAEQVHNLPAPAGLARASDPDTSHEAAATVGAGIETAVLDVLRTDAAAYGPDDRGLTDDQIVACLPGCHPPSIKSARSRLLAQGAVKDTGERRPSNRGSAMMVWTVTE